MQAEYELMVKNRTPQKGIRGTVAEVRNLEKQWEVQKEQEAETAINAFRKYYTGDKFLHTIPFLDKEGVPIPEWLRSMMAKKAADAFCNKEQERIYQELRRWKANNAPKTPDWQKALAHKVHTPPGASRRGRMMQNFWKNSMTGSIDGSF